MHPSAAVGVCHSWGAWPCSEPCLWWELGLVVCSLFVAGIVGRLHEGVVLDVLRVALPRNHQLPRDRVVPCLQVLHGPLCLARVLQAKHGPQVCVLWHPATVFALRQSSLCNSLHSATVFTPRQPSLSAMGWAVHHCRLQEVSNLRKELQPSASTSMLGLCVSTHTGKAGPTLAQAFFAAIL